MQVSEILSQECTQETGEVTIQGIFVMTGGVGYFIESKDDIDNKARAVMVDYPGLEKLLMSRVPAYGGSRYSYCDEAVITGTLKMISDSSFHLTIDTISQFVIYKYGEPIVVLS